LSTSVLSVRERTYDMNYLRENIQAEDRSRLTASKARTGTLEMRKQNNTVVRGTGCSNRREEEQCSEREYEYDITLRAERKQDNTSHGQARHVITVSGVQ
jgi:hypothetical protein